MARTRISGRRSTAPPGAAADSIARARIVQGKELSFNNIADADTALECVRQFDRDACVIVKHANPCGVASAASIGDAYELAYRTDPTSAFGGIIAFNRPVDADTARSILGRQFVEVLVAPALLPGAADVLAAKPNVRVLVTGTLGVAAAERELRSVERRRARAGARPREASMRAPCVASRPAQPTPARSCAISHSPGGWRST